MMHSQIIRHLLLNNKDKTLKMNQISKKRFIFIYR